MRTFRWIDIEASRLAWADYAPKWRVYRDLAADRGMLYPPEGSRWDEVTDQWPSQRAILQRAIDDTPNTLRAAIAASRTWGEVVGLIISAQNDIRSRLADPPKEGPDRDEAAAILARLGRG